MRQFSNLGAFLVETVPLLRWTRILKVEMVEVIARIMSILEMGQHVSLAIKGSTAKRIVFSPLIPLTFTFQVLSLKAPVIAFDPTVRRTARREI
jgi:hypothetical protein